MSRQDRREFLSKSMALGMAPIFTGTSLSSPEVTADSMPAQQAPAEFFSGFKREQIKTSGTTINAVYGGKGSPILLRRSLRLFKTSHGARHGGSNEPHGIPKIRGCGT